MYSNRNGFYHRGVLKGESFGETVEDIFGYGDIFRKCPITTIIAARDAQNLPVIAQIDVATTAEMAVTAGDRRVESDPFAGVPRLDVPACLGDDTGRFVAHHQWRNPAAGRTIQAVDVAPADPASPNPNQDVIWTDLRLGHVGHFQFHVLL